MRIRAGALTADGSDPAFGIRVHPRRLGRGEHDIDPGEGEDRVEGGTELRITVESQMAESVPGLLQVGDKIASDLHGPLRHCAVGRAVTPSR